MYDGLRPINGPLSPFRVHENIINRLYGLVFHQTSIILDNIASELLTREGTVGLWPMDELIHHPCQFLFAYS